MTEQTRPSEPGLWTRDGKFYRVWKKPADGRFTAAEITQHGEQLGTFWADTLAGNWRKLTAEPATGEDWPGKNDGWVAPPRPWVRASRALTKESTWVIRMPNGDWLTTAGAHWAEKDVTLLDAPPRPTFTAPPKPEKTIELTLQAPIGSAVHWKTLGGKEHVGKLIEWDSNVAIVKTEQGVKAVEC